MSEFASEVNERVEQARQSLAEAEAAGIALVVAAAKSGALLSKSCVAAVCTWPGTIALMRMPSGAPSIAAAAVKCTSAAFEAE